MSVYDVDSIMAQVRRLALLPANSTVGTADTDLLAILNGELRVITSRLKKLYQDFGTVSMDVTIINGTDTYSIPTRASTASLRDIWFVRQDGSYRLIQKVDLSEIPLLYPGILPLTAGEPQSFYLKGNSIVLFPKPSASTTTTLRMFYYQRPSQLVASNTVGIISSINTGTGAVTLTGAAPSGFGSSNTFDFVKGTPHFDIEGTDASGTVSGSTVTFSPSSLPSALAVGDYVCLSGQTPVPQLPAEYQDLLVERCVLRVVEALGDNEKLAAVQARVAELEEDAFQAVQPRVDGKQPVLTSRWWF